MPSLHIIYASTSGNTEYVVDVLKQSLLEKDSSLHITLERAERAGAEDFTKSDLLILASGTWNTGGREGQVNPYMFELLYKKAKDVDLAGKQCAVIGLGDHRYKYTARATEHMAHYIKGHKGNAFLPPLVIVDEPFGQEGKVKMWGEELLKKLSTLS